MTLQERINTGHMTTYQWGVVILATALNLLDGFDVLALYRFRYQRVLGPRWDPLGLPLICWPGGYDPWLCGLGPFG